ncbi:MAG TPA: hypothetical protein PLS45_00015 [Bacillota bacterium]|nr:hypothetical protein [Bacillota bacterium]
MTASIRLDNNEAKQTKQIIRFFKKGVKSRYNKKLTGKVRLYISEKNSVKNISDILSLYENRLN